METPGFIPLDVVKPKRSAQEVRVLLSDLEKRSNDTISDEERSQNDMQWNALRSELGELKLQETRPPWTSKEVHQRREELQARIDATEDDSEKEKLREGFPQIYRDLRRANEFELGETIIREEKARMKHDKLISEAYQTELSALVEEMMVGAKKERGAVYNIGNKLNEFTLGQIKIEVFLNAVRDPDIKKQFEQCLKRYFQKVTGKEYA